MFGGVSASHKLSNDLGNTFDLVQLSKCKYFSNLLSKTCIVELFAQQHFLHL